MEHLCVTFMRKAPYPWPSDPCFSSAVAFLLLCLWPCYETILSSIRGTTGNKLTNYQFVSLCFSVVIACKIFWRINKLWLNIELYERSLLVVKGQRTVMLTSKKLFYMISEKIAACCYPNNFFLVYISGPSSSGSSFWCNAGGYEGIH